MIETRNYILKDNGYAQGIILTNRYSRNFAIFLELSQMAKKFFPNLTNEKIFLGWTTATHSENGLTLIHFQLPFNAEAEGFSVVNNLDFQFE